MAATSTTAPGRLELVRAFVNTRDLDDGTDSFDHVASLAGWLTANGLLAAAEASRLAEADRARAVAAREAFRELLLANNDGRPADGGSVATLNDVAARAAVSIRLDAHGHAHLDTTARGVDAALGRLLLVAFEAMEAGEWRRLKVCRNDACRWSFYDHSKNRSKTWCSMDVCGSQAKSRAYRVRRRTRDAGAGAVDP